jgi:4'-phosphopantetheinyl transferase
LARRLAADWLQADVARVALHRHDDGRPQLLVDGAPSPLSLSLSHSGDWLACAIANVPVGIDVELPRRVRNLQALARFTFAPEEVERLLRMPEEKRPSAFHMLWTLKEARGKRSGEGLLPEQSRRINTLQSEAGEADAIGWSFHDGALALAVDAGTEISVEGGEALGSPAFWRYVESR